VRSQLRSRWFALALACGLLGAPAAWADQPGQTEDIEVPPPPPPTRQAPEPAPPSREPAPPTAQPAPPPMEQPVAAGPPGFVERLGRSVADAFRGSDFE
jgi:hypothetical protein